MIKIKFSNIKILLACLLLIICTALPALDISIRPKGYLFVPLGPGNETEDGNSRYTLGGGADLNLEADLSTIWSNPLGLGYTLGLEGSMLFNALKGDTPKNVQAYSIGGSLGLYWVPLSRLITRIDGMAGGYWPSLEGSRGDPGFYIRGGGEILFRFTPVISAGANVGWRHFFLSGDNSGSFNSGLYAGLTAQITFEAGTRGRRESTIIVFEQDEPVYPAFLQLYQNNSIGTIVLRNNENAEIRDVRVSFRANRYTTSEFLGSTISLLPRGRSVTLPLLADFSPEILQFTDTGRILGEVVIQYHFLGQERESVHTVTVAAYNRNTVTEGDAAALAAFISPTSPEVLEFSRHVSGIARNNRRTGHNSNMQFAVWLFEGLRASGIRLGTTYSSESEVQFPSETLAYGTGDVRDLALLFATSLESTGVPSALIELENDFIVAVSLEASQAAGETLFNGVDRILIIDDEVWLPVAMSAFNEGFTAAWNRATTLLNRAFAGDEEIDFVFVEHAWADYPPAPLPELGGRAVQTDLDTVSREANRVLQQYIDQELQPLLRQVQAQTGANATAVMFNRLGLLQLRVGRIADAKASYERAAGMGSVPAMTNRGNIALNEKDYATAERWFRQALSRDSQNAGALLGLEQIEALR